MRKAGLALVMLLGCCGATARAATVIAFWLPARGIEDADRGRLARIASKVAQRTGAVLLAPGGGPGLREQIARAKKLMIQGALDEAATLLDQALAEAALERMGTDDEAEWIAGALRRASIALARGEVGLARQLLGRLLRADPAFELRAGENTPSLRAVLVDVQKQLGPDPAIDPGDLGAACRAADVVLVARALRAGAEVVRFDACREVARARLADGDEAAAAALASVAPATTPRVERRRRSRGKLIAGSVCAVVGLALAATGSYYAAHAAAQKDTIDGACTAASPCAGPDLQRWAGDYDAARISASVLLPIGAAALVAGGVLLGVGLERDRSTVTISPAASGLRVEGTW